MLKLIILIQPGTNYSGNGVYWLQECHRINARKNFVNSLLWGMVSSELHYCVANIHDPHLMWKALEKQASNSAGIAALSMYGALNEASIDKDETLTAFFARITQMRDHLKNTDNEVTDKNFRALVLNKCRRR
jgi:ribosomal protein S15P/S13E